MKEIGGYFELELNDFGTLYHDQSLSFNSGSSALRFFLQNSSYKRLYVPYYTCGAVIKTIKSMGLELIFYKLNEDLSPNVDFQIFNTNSLLIYNDYFGLNQHNIKKVLECTKHVLIDAAQSFYYKPPKGYYSFNSVRKFFGVPDGGFLCGDITDSMLDSYNKLKYHEYSTIHLIDRLEKGANHGFLSYQKNEKILSEPPAGKMSKLTARLLRNINFEEVKERRIENFKYLNSKLESLNQILIESNSINTPMCYPFLIDGGSEIKEYLISKNIYIPTYWKSNIPFLESTDSFEKHLIDNVISLPIDQRYGELEMNYIVELVEELS